jgi:RNA polymerase sigma-70 factor, ECF subfamily
MADPDPGTVTALLQAWSRGDAAAGEKLAPLVYDDLHRRASRYFRRERREHTLQPTALVHEAFVRLAAQQGLTWQNRAQFLGLAAVMMRRILVDHARARASERRGGPWLRVTLDESVAWEQARELELIDLDEALRDLAEHDPRQARLVELRFFGGLRLEDAAEVAGVSLATAKRDWTMARAWLYRRLKTPGQ